VATILIKSRYKKYLKTKYNKYCCSIGLTYMYRIKIAWLSILFIVCSATTHAETLLNQWAWSQWSNNAIVGATDYEPVTDLVQGVVVKATSHDSASRLTLNKQIKLTQSPVLHWSWLAAVKPQKLTKDELGIEAIESDFDEVEFDDYVARIQVGKSNGAFSFGEKRLTYIWSSQENEGAEWSINEHEYAIVVTGKKALLETWYRMKRNIKDDWMRVFDEDIASIDSVAIMTDSDGTGGVAKAYYGPISTRKN
jgi:hypothetical protein